MLKVTGLTKIYKTKYEEVKALDNVSLEFNAPSLTFIVGRSGSGKSTLLNILGGLDTFDSGEIELDGEKYYSKEDSRWVQYRRNNIGFVFQDNNLLNNFTVRENLELVVHNGQNKLEKIEKILKEVGLTGLENRKARDLSGGQKQRVAIARALLKESKIILADEPTGNVDRKTSEEIFKLLKTISKEKLVIVITHDEKSANEYGDDIIEIDDGRIVNIISLKNSTDNDILKQTIVKNYFVAMMRLSYKMIKSCWSRMSLLIFAMSVLIALASICFSNAFIESADVIYKRLFAIVLVFTTIIALCLYLNYIIHVIDDNYMDYGVLKAIGISNAQLCVTLYSQVIFAGFISALIGFSLGYVFSVCFYNSMRELFDIQIVVDVKSILLTMVFIICISIIATTWPIVRIVRAKPCAIIRDNRKLFLYSNSSEWGNNFAYFSFC